MMSFAAIIGHDVQKKQLEHAWRSNRLAHSYLFCGEAGIGKRLVALAFTQMIFCQQHSGCGVCLSCQRLAHDNHPDLHLVATEEDRKEIRIEQIRHLQQQLNHPPREAARRVCIIDNAEEMNTAAANALLKTLEEPRPDVLIILVSAKPQRLLDTVRSRCQQLQFQRLDRAAITSVIEQHCPGKQSEVLAALAQGSPGRILGCDSSDFIEQRQQIFTALCTFNSDNIVDMLSLSEQLAANKEHLDYILTILLSCYRDIFLLIHRAPAKMICNIDMLELLRQRAAAESVLSIHNKLAAIITCQQQLRHNANARLAMDVLFMHLSDCQMTK